MAGFQIDEMFTAGDARIFIGDGLAAVPMPDPEDIETLIASGTPIAGLVDLGDTKIDETITFEEDEAQYDTKGTLQHRTLKEVLTTAAVSRFSVNSVQPRSGRVMELYYGGGTEGDGYFDAPTSGNSSPTELPVLIVFKDGAELFPAFFPRVSVRRNGTITFPMDDFAEVPLAGTVLDPESGPPVRWYSETFTAAIP